MITEIEKNLERKRLEFEEHEKKKFAQYRLEQNKLLLSQRNELNRKHKSETKKLEDALKQLAYENKRLRAYVEVTPAGETECAAVDVIKKRTRSNALETGFESNDSKRFDKFS